MREGSSTSKLAALGVGERFYIDTTLDNYASDMRVALVPRSRRPAELAQREFEAALFTAVSARDASQVRYLICIERTK